MENVLCHCVCKWWFFANPVTFSELKSAGKNNALHTSFAAYDGFDIATYLCCIVRQLIGNYLCVLFLDQQIQKCEHNISRSN